MFTKGAEFEQEFHVSKDVYNGFLATFKDNNPLHTEEPFAKRKGFDGKVMHGNILNGFLSFFIGECLPTKDLIIHSQEIHYKRPVYLGDVLKMSAKIADVFESVNAVEFKYRFTNIDKQVVARGKFQIGLLS